MYGRRLLRPHRASHFDVWEIYHPACEPSKPWPIPLANVPSVRLRFLDIIRSVSHTANIPKSFNYRISDKHRAYKAQPEYSKFHTFIR